MKSYKYFIIANFYISSYHLHVEFVECIIFKASNVFAVSWNGIQWDRCDNNVKIIPV